MTKLIFREILILLCFAPFCQGSDTKPNVVFILADDLGYGDLSSYGATKVLTPNIDSLATEGLRFTDAHSPSSVCTPTRYNLLTGRYAWRTWVGGSTVWANDPLLPDPNRYTLADLFKDQGYATACIGKWHLGFGQPDMEGWDDILGPDYNRDLKPGPLELGFDYFWGFPHVGQFPHFIIENHKVLGLDPNDPIRMTPDKRPGFELDYLHRPRSGLAAALRVEGGKQATYKHENLSNRLTERAVNWLENVRKDQPFFLYLAHRNIHGPLKPDPRFAGTNEIGKRGDFILELDHSIGEVLQAIEQNGLKDNTLVIFTSDNGGIHKYEPIDHAEDNGHFINGPLRGQKTSVYEGGQRVPMMARWPGHIQPGQTSDELIALTDVIATFADFFQVSLPPDTAEDSFSFLGSLLNKTDRQIRRTTLVNDSFTELLSIREGPWKLILSQGGGGAKAFDTLDPQLPPMQLYNLDSDLRESENLFFTEPIKVQHLQHLMNRYHIEGRSAPIDRRLFDN